ncbi:MAG: CDP-alcohol phosphatidyltransferase family protein [Chloroflexi bacterium]|nr:CDP-alcohol phosphatidyltransferase family protein [Chloroflexota bacterium]
MAGIYQVKPAFQRSLGGVEQWLVERRVHPDWLTCAALVLSLAGGVALYLAPDHRWLLVLIPIVVVVRTTLNALDGLVAQRTGLARPWGEVLNEFSDRVADVALLGSLALATPGLPLLGEAVVVLMLLTSYLAILSKAAGGRRQYAGPMGKADRMLLLGVAALVGLFVPLTFTYTAYLGLVLIGLLLTLAARTRSTYDDLQSAR